MTVGGGEIVLCGRPSQDVVRVVLYTCRCGRCENL